jgi:glycerophosphoryl diester phosphodiesterase
VLAHRGLATGSPENSLAAFQAAMDAGADVIECDVRATKDNVAVFAHDETLERVFGNPARVRDLTYLDITQLAAAGLPKDHGVISVADALVRLPKARFNIDVKESHVIEPLAQAVVDMQAFDRVLITSFSGARRRSTLSRIKKLSGSSVMTSGSADTVAGVVLACFVGATWLARRWSRGVRILQIPVRVLGVNTSSPRMLRKLHSAGFVVQFWTINEVAEARRLVDAGADGLVTDRCDVLVPIFRTRSGKAKARPLR